MAYEGLTPEQLAIKFGGVPIDAGANLETLARKLGGTTDAYDPTSGMGPVDRTLAGIGKGFVDIGRGLGQRFGVLNQSDIDEARKYDAPLMNTATGTAGSIVGNVAAFAPAAFVPGANTVLGAAAIGGLNGFVQPTAQGESALRNTVTNAALGGGSQAVLGAASKAASNYLSNAQAQRALLQSQNAVQDATLRDAQAIGLGAPPSTVNPSFLNRRLEGLAGKANVQQEFSLANDAAANNAIRADLGVPQASALTPKVAMAVRKQAYQSGYAPVESLGRFNVSPEFGQELDAITSSAKDVAKDFPGAAKSTIQELVDDYRPPNGTADAANAIKASQILRDNARALYIAGDSQTAKASLQLSEALQNEIERQLQASGKNGAELLKKFKDARTLMAKAHSAEDAMRIGTGRVEASAFGKMAQDGVPLSGNQAVVGNFANAFPKAVQKPAQIGSPGVSALEGALSMLAAGGGFAHSGPVGLAAGAIPYMVRPGAKALVTSPLYQKLLAQPQYSNLLAPRAAAGLLSAADRAALGGLLGPYLSANSAQQ